MYPFSSYSYEMDICTYNYQMYEFHKNQMMFYQQYMGLSQAIPTAETFFNTEERMNQRDERHQ